MTYLSKINPIDFNSIEITKQSVSSNAKTIIDLVKDGEIDAIDAILKLKAISDMYEEVRVGISEEVLSALSNSGGTIAKYGATIKQKEVGTKYDFTATEVWTKLTRKEKDLAEERKKLEATIKTLSKPTEILVEDELVKLMPPIKTSTTSFEIKL